MNFFNTVQSFFHSVTTNDRYASYDSRGPRAPRSDAPESEAFSRPGLMPLGNSSSTSLDGTSHPYGGGANNHPYGNGNHPYGNAQGANSSTHLASSSNSSVNRVPYTPGMRSNQLGNGGIPLQDYAEGIPPPPAPAVSFRRIDRWIEMHYAELFDQLNYPATSADLNELEADLDCTLPLDVRDALMVHDGQERGGMPCGLIFGITLLDLEGIAEEWDTWKTTAIKINRMLQQQRQQKQREAPGPSRKLPQQGGRPPQLSWLERQESVPEGAIQRVYAHPAWIPLAKDFEGNNIGVDLAPGPKGRWGQVILFGRDFDRKYVVAPSWAHFLATFADDLENGEHYIDDDLEHGDFRFRAPNGRLVSYFDVLRSRVDRHQRQSRKAAPARTQSPSTLPNSTAAASRRQSHTSTPSTRNSSPTNARRTSGKLISPMTSTTNLPGTIEATPKSPLVPEEPTTITSPTIDSTTAEKEEPEKDSTEQDTAKDLDKAEANDSKTEASQDKEDKDSNSEEVVKKEPVEEKKSTEIEKTESTKPIDGDEDDEIDLLKDEELSEVEI